MKTTVKLGALAALAFANAGHAAIVNFADPGAFDAGSLAGTLALDFDVAGASSISANITPQAPSEAFNSVLTDDGIASPWVSFEIALSGATFDTSVLGTVTENFGLASSTVLLSSSVLQVFFSAADPVTAEVGNVLGLGGLNFAILAGDNYTLTFTPNIVPLPAALWLLLSGLAGLALKVRRPARA